MTKMDKYHTTCAKCEAEIAFVNGYCVDENLWLCDKCYREDDKQQLMDIGSVKQGRYGSVVNERAS